MNYYIKADSVNKAKNDVDELLHDWGYHDLSNKNHSQGKIAHFFHQLTGVMRILTHVHSGDTLILQYPFKKFYYMACTFAHWKGATVVTIVHDLGAFRRHKLTPEQENRQLSKTDKLIVHNETMEKWVKAHGFKGKTVCLGIFDYLISTKPHAYPTPHRPWRIVYAGGLYKWRNAYLYNLDSSMNLWTLDLYGPGYEALEKDPKITWHGNLKEEQLMEQVEGDFGLVWDGGSLDECNGDWGSYLKINNPHKTSFYICAGIPVIVWKKAAMRNFIEDNNLGFSIDSIKDIDEKLRNMTPEQYKTMRDSVARFSALLRKGHFTEKSFKD